MDTFSKGLGSHDYLIYLTEARRLLGEQVTFDPAQENLIWQLYQDYAQEMRLGVPYDPAVELSRACPKPDVGTPVPRTAVVEQCLAVIESTSVCDAAIKRINLTERQISLPNGRIETQILQEVVSAGWERRT